MSDVVNKIKKIYNTSYAINPLCTIFITVSIIFLSYYLIMLILTCGNIINLTLFNNRNDYFMDFFHSVYDSLHGPYTECNVIYPPFTVMIYATLGNIIYAFTGDIDAFEMRNSIAGMTVYIITTIIVVVLLMWLSNKKLKQINHQYKTIILILILLSLPLLFAIDRGNCIIYAVTFSLMFVCFYNSDNKKSRIIAYIAIGIATGLKIYPALLILLLLKDKKWKETCVCVLIVASIFLIPFLLFENSLSLLTNILSYTSSTTIGTYTIKDLFYGLSNFIPVEISSIIGWIVTIALLLSTLYIVIKKEINNWKILTLICINLSIGFGVGTAYLCLYMIIPILFFITEEIQPSKENKYYCCTFAFILVLFGFPIDIPQYVTYTISTSLKSVAIMIMCVYLLYTTFKKCDNKNNGD